MRFSEQIAGVWVLSAVAKMPAVELYGCTTVQLRILATPRKASMFLAPRLCTGCSTSAVAHLAPPYASSLRGTGASIRAISSSMKSHTTNIILSQSGVDWLDEQR